MSAPTSPRMKTRIRRMELYATVTDPQAQADRDELRDALAQVIRAVNRPDLPEVQGALLTLERTKPGRPA